MLCTAPDRHIDWAAELTSGTLHNRAALYITMHSPCTATLVLQRHPPVMKKRPMSRPL